MNINKPISRRRALKVMGLGMLAACVPTLPSFGKLTKDNEKKIKRLIFYFSATGNSLYTARQIGGEESENAAVMAASTAEIWVSASPMIITSWEFMPISC